MQTPSMLNISAHIYYDGMVQGVGFRFAVDRAASSLGLKGWVRNLDDGRVEVLCEGSKPHIESFIERMKAIFKAHIRDVNIDWSEATGEYDRFNIRFD